MADGSAPSPDALYESPAPQSQPSLDLPVLPVPPAPAPLPPVAGVTAFHPHLAISRIFGHVSTDLSLFVQDVWNHYDVPDGQQSLGCTQTNREQG